MWIRFYLSCHDWYQSIATKEKHVDTDKLNICDRESEIPKYCNTREILKSLRNISGKVIKYLLTTLNSRYTVVLSSDICKKTKQNKNLTSLPLLVNRKLFHEHAWKSQQLIMRFDTIKRHIIISIFFHIFMTF